MPRTIRNPFHRRFRAGQVPRDLTNVEARVLQELFDKKQIRPPAPTDDSFRAEAIRSLMRKGFADKVRLYPLGRDRQPDFSKPVSPRVALSERGIGVLRAERERIRRER